VRLVCGLDGAYAGGRAFAAAVVLRLPGLGEVERSVASLPVPFPYVPGLLSFREAPAFALALRGLRTAPDLLLVDGQGIAHPRRMGLACHVGLLAGAPSIGVAKSVLVGAFEPPPRAAGSSSPLRHRGEVVGAAVRLRDGGGPVFVSPGHLCDLRWALRRVLACAAGHRLPEPVFLADRAAGEAAAEARGNP
jgi:deoxyribonuclease V